MTLGQRIEERRKLIGLSQAELARQVGVRQSTMNSLINGDSRTSRSILKIARTLRTTPAYLAGDTDDPDEGAPPPPPEPKIQHVMMPVALPAEPALEAMFQGLLRSLPPEVQGDALAHELAKLLPIGLGQLRGPLRYETMAERDAAREAAQVRAREDRVRQRA